MWKQPLDRAHSPAQLDALEADAASVAVLLEAELPAVTTLAELEARDAQLAVALDAIEAVAIRAMKVRMEYALAADSSIGPPTRNVFAQTVVNYARNLSLLADRVRDLAARGRAGSPDHVADLVVECARSALGLREALRAGVLDLVRRLATAGVPEADRRARDRTLDDALRVRWSSARRDLEALAAEPARIATPMATRVVAFPAQLDEPEPEREATFAEMIELD